MDELNKKIFIRAIEWLILLLLSTNIVLTISILSIMFPEFWLD